VAFIHHGRIIKIGSLQTAEGDPLVVSDLSVEIRARPREGSAAEDGERWKAIVDGLNRWAHHVRVDREIIHATISSEGDLPHMTRYLVEQDIDVYAVSPHRLSLEDQFMQLIEDERE
jgi:ABC-type multidrug transport system ATPase subunit